MTDTKAREDERLKITDYEQMARVVHLYFKEWCDESLPYPAMCADAVREASAAYEALQKECEELRAANANCISLSLHESRMAEARALVRELVKALTDGEYNSPISRLMLMAEGEGSNEEVYRAMSKAALEQIAPALEKAEKHLTNAQLLLNKPEGER